VAGAGANDRGGARGGALFAATAAGAGPAGRRKQAMSSGFQAVLWNRAKYIYDAILLAAVTSYIALFLLIAWRLAPPQGAPEWIDVCLRATGTCAFLMLTLILSIGPLARLDRRFLPLLYNRRHFGVLLFFIALVHALLMVLWFYNLNALPNLVAEFTNWPAYGKFIGFPFKTLGLAALLILLLMAATSHDYWLSLLSPPVWKTLHMAVYFAYGLVLLHVALGVVQTDRNPIISTMLVASFIWVAGLHLLAGRREGSRDRGTPAGADGWLAVGSPQSIPDKGARIVAAPGGERIAVFRDGNEVGALSNLCAHQNGPIGEGCIIDGLVTCPWHGYQYKLKDGCAPPPFTEKLATYRVRFRNGMIEVHPEPLAPGTPTAIVLG
jgi:nitrite reductase/ring-hydroxylating ferredoxin subunit/DMSO/TMAO reductase YedYZ heme-binding membrane subunit